MGRYKGLFSTAVCLIVLFVVLVLPFEYRKETKKNKELTEELTTAQEEIKELEYRLEEKEGEIVDLEESLDFYTDFSWELSEQCDFYDQNACIVTVSGEKYHRYECYHWQTGNGFWIFNVEYAESLGYEPCLDCY